MNRAASAPPFRDQVTGWSAVKLWTDVVFSAIDAVLVESPALPDGPVIRGRAIILDLGVIRLLYVLVNWEAERPLIVLRSNFDRSINPNCDDSM